MLAVIDALRESTVDVQPPFIVFANGNSLRSACAREARRQVTRLQACPFMQPHL